MNRFDLIVFDLDGTLIDSLQDLADSVNYVLSKLAGPTLAAAQVQEFVGNGAPELVRRSLLAAGIAGRNKEALEEFLDYYQKHCVRNTRLYPGVIDTLQPLQQRVSLAVLTNKPSASTERILELLDVRGFFRIVAGGDTFAGRKPDPDGLLSIMSRLATVSLRTLMVGDSEVDMQTGRSVGAVTCCAGWGMKSREVKTADIVIAHPGELLTVLD